MTSRKARKPRTVTNSRAFLDEQTPEEGREGLRKAIVDYASLLGYLVHHCYQSILCGPHAGMPDLVLVGFGRVIFVELKKQTGKKRAAQEVWAAALSATQAEYYFWRPSDWSNGTVERTLAPAA